MVDSRISNSDGNNPQPGTAGDRLLEILRETGALLEGHFLLTSGLHSSRYLQCALVLQHPQHAEWIGRSMANSFNQLDVSAVVAPAIGGILVARLSKVCYT